MIKSLTSKLFGSSHDRQVKKLAPMVAAINALEPTYEAMSNEELAAQSELFKKRLTGGETLDQLQNEVFAVVREVSKRTMNMRHFDVQLIGGHVLHTGRIAEMKTGEGKTLVATLAMVLNALEGKGAHLVTVNDYLARRDAQWMSPIYLFLGLTVGISNPNASYQVVWDDPAKFTTKIIPSDRSNVYRCDITYGTNNEFGFDYLRDNMKYSLEEYVQRELNFAIVDEVDSILIDEARTPLIISGPTDETTDKYIIIDKVVRKLEMETHFTVDEKSRNAKLTDAGNTVVEQELGIENLYDIVNVDTLHYVNNALKAHFVFKRDVDYVVQNNKVVIVDEFTGRLMAGRRYSDGQHQALEAKELVPVENENQTLASITFQNYFRMYKKLAGMTGTAVTEEQEFLEIYGLGVVVIPTHRKMVRDDRPDVIYRTVEEKYLALIQDIVENNKIGRPVLVGTTSIDKSEMISKVLKKHNIKHEVLNAKNHEREAEIVARAGAKGAVTIATNMAGRGTDIKLGDGVLELGGLHIIGTERHESRRIDNQLRGRSGRQGDAGSSRFYLSLEDDLLRIFGSDKIKFIMDKLGMAANEPIEHGMITKAIENAQKKVEGMHFEIRKHLLNYDTVANQQRQVVYGLRREILDGREIDTVLGEYIDATLEGVFGDFVGDYTDHEALQAELKKIFTVDVDVSLVTKKTMAEEIEKTKHAIVEKLMGRKDEFGVHFIDFCRFLLLNILDGRWKEHLLTMDHLRDSVGLRGYGQKDPLLEYKKEAYKMFATLMDRVYSETMETLFHVQVKREAAPVEIAQKKQVTHEEKKDIFGGGNQQGEQKKTPQRRNMPKVGRNDPCPCGSGKKYKACHGKTDVVVQDEDELV